MSQIASNVGVPPAARRAVKPACRLAITLAWLAAVAAGFIGLWAYSVTPGAPSEPPQHWPAGADALRTSGKSVLLMFVHPRCPCTRSSLAELAEILSESETRVATRLVILRPSDVDADWSETDIARQAKELTGDNIAWDYDGLLAEQFHVHTSGHVLYYDASGELKFQGGITAARGQAGPNDGSAALRDALKNKASPKSATSVFGCPIQSPPRSV